MPRPDSLPVWKVLQSLAARPALNLPDSFKTDPERAQRFSCEAAGVLLDYSKQPVDQDILDALVKLAEESELPSWISKMFSGEAVNHTEDRPALHMALRADDGSPFPSDKNDVMSAVSDCKAQMAKFVESVRSGHWKGGSGEIITDVVNIGIGGSDLGPRMFVKALQPYVDANLKAHFVGNGDGAEIHEVLSQLNPATTLFLVVSKSFTTTETLANAELAREWLKQSAGTADLAQHFVAITASVEKAAAFGAAEILPFWDWVGGRFSVWSAVGVSVALMIGMDAFEDCLAGARAMDGHFRSADLSTNIPVMMGLLGVWHTNFLRVNQHVVLPYTNYLRWLPPYLQQLEMESNGKGVDREGQSVSYATVPALWGEVGTNAQHAFMQRLHQGPQNVPVDFILPLKLQHPHKDHHDSLVANCLAQAEALMNGRQLETDPQRSLPGNRPSSMIMLPDLSPRSLGALIALYEHKVFVQAVIWNINPFDQWGVEEGKRLAGELLKDIQDESAGDHDPSTQALLKRYLDQR